MAGFLSTPETNTGVGKWAIYHKRRNEINHIIKDLFPPLCTEKQILCPWSHQKGGSVCNECPKFSTNWGDLTGYDAADRAIRDAFGYPSRCGTCCSAILTKELIFIRLTIIDSLFSTQTNKGYYIKQNMVDAIWDACDDGSGVHSDETLAIKASNYILWIRSSANPVSVQQKPQQVQEIEDLIYQHFAWVKTAKNNKQCELSLMTKYLHYLVELVQPDDTQGFPIYDSKIRAILYKVHAYIGSNLARGQKQRSASTAIPYWKYVVALGEIADDLQINGYAFGNVMGMTIFHILDCFLWPLGKIYACIQQKSPDYTDLWMSVSQFELVNMLAHGAITSRLKALETLAQKI